jgi:pseudaminic acid cytidylyltransferase
MSSIAIIPARGGSKRIPRKNIRDFLGKPIIAYSIEAALTSGLFEEVMVSTDDDEIAAVARKYGASVPFLRSKKNSDDLATTVDVLLEVLKSYESIERTFEFGCCIYPTAPLASPEKIKEGRDLLITGNYDTVFPIVKFSAPIWRALQQNERKVSMIWPENMTKRSQDLPDAFHDAGQWYWFQKRRVFSAGKLWTENTSAVVIGEMEVQDIDNESDWKLAEMKYKLLKG